MQLLESLRWRYATKRFAADRTVPAEDIRLLKQATNLAATSFGLQPFRVAVVSDPDLKQRLRAAGYDQPQFTEASHIFVFAARRTVTPGHVDAFIDRMAEVREVPRERIAGYGDYIKSSIEGKSAEFLHGWSVRQAYLALGTLLAAAGERRIDACPMEGFDTAQFDEILGLGERGLAACVVAAVGYRSPEDQTQHAAKVRVPLGELFLDL